MHTKNRSKTQHLIQNWQPIIPTYIRRWLLFDLLR